MMKSYLSLIPISARVHRKQNRMTLLCIILSVFLVTAIFSMADVWIAGEAQAMIRRHGNHHIILHNMDEAAGQMSLQNDIGAAAEQTALWDDIAAASGQTAPWDDIDAASGQTAPWDDIDAASGQTAPWDDIDVTSGQTAPWTDIDAASGQTTLRNNIDAAAWYGMLNKELDKPYCVLGKSAVLCGADPSYILDIRQFPVEGSFPRNHSEVMLHKGAEKLLAVKIGDSIVLNTPKGDVVYTVSGFCDDYDADYLDRAGAVIVYLDKTELLELIHLCGEDVSWDYYVRFNESTGIRNAAEDLKKAIKEQCSSTEIQIEENRVTLGAAGASSDESIKNIYALAGVMFLLVLMAGVLMISSCMNSNIAQRTEFFGMLRCIGASREQIIRFVRLEALNWCKTAIPAGCVLGIFMSWILCFVLGHLVKGEFAEFRFRFSIIGIVSGVAVGIVTVLLAAHSPARRAARVSPVAAVSGNAEESGRISRAANTRLWRVETALGVDHAVTSRKNLILMTLSFALTIILFFAFSGLLDFAKKLLPSMSNLSPDISIVSADQANSMREDLVDDIRKVPGVSEVFGTAFSYDTPAKINGSAGSIDLISYDAYLLDIFHKSVVSGDIDKVYGDSNYALITYTQESRLDTGDRIQVGDVELEVACVVSEGVGSTDKRPSVCCSEETYRRITGETGYTLINANLSRDATEQTVEQIAALAGENEMEDRRAEDQESNKSYWVFRLAAYGFLAIITLITIFNIMNSISMSVSARIRQYGAMRAVGMSVGQLTKMIAAEAVTYAGCGSLVGCVCGLLLHRFISVRLIYDHFGGRWTVPAGPMVMILLIVAASCAAAVYAPYQRIRGLSITDTILAQ